MVDVQTNISSEGTAARCVAHQRGLGGRLRLLQTLQGVVARDNNSADVITEA